MGARISVLGLGNMGAALASTVLSSSGQVTVWNRTPAKADKLVAAGAMLAGSAADAIAGTDICIVCVGTYAHAGEMLGACADLSGKTLVQLSTGTPEQATAMKQWASERGARYLDGAILAYPSDIGGRDTMIIYAGDRAAWDTCEPSLRPLGGASRYVGTNLAAPEALEFAIVGGSLLATMGVIEGARALENAGVDVGLLSELIAGSGPFFVKGMRSQLDAIAQGRFSEPEASLGLWAAGIEHWADVRDPDIDVFRPARELIRRAVAAGYSAEELAAVIKVLRAQAG
jgi:3-hydroxyisobutyrate dehydrogenase-like beta-hydroxyacid dehydrogenase